MTSFSFFKYFDAFELDVNVVDFVYYGKTRLSTPVSTTYLPRLKTSIIIQFFHSPKISCHRRRFSVGTSAEVVYW